MTRNDRIKKLYSNGYTYKSIGLKYKITAQRIRQIVTGYGSVSFLSYATRPNLLRKNCDCGKLATQIHHIDRNCKNNKSNNLISLCKICHSALHKGKRKKYNKLALDFL